MLNILGYSNVSFVKKQYHQVAQVRSFLRSIDVNIKDQPLILVLKDQEIVLRLLKSTEVGSMPRISYSATLLGIAFSDDEGSYLSKFLLYLLSNDGMSGVVQGSHLPKANSFESILSSFSDLPVDNSYFFNCYKIGLNYILDYLNKSDEPVAKSDVCAAFMMSFAEVVTDYFVSGQLEINKTDLIGLIPTLSLIRLIDMYSYLDEHNKSINEPIDAEKYIKLKYTRGHDFVNGEPIVKDQVDQIEDSDLSAEVTDDDVKLKDPVAPPPTFMGVDVKQELNEPWMDMDYGYPEGKKAENDVKVEKYLSNLESDRIKDNVSLDSVVDEFKNNNPVVNKPSNVQFIDSRLGKSLQYTTHTPDKINRYTKKKVDAGSTQSSSESILFSKMTNDNISVTNNANTNNNAYTNTNLNTSTFGLPRNINNSNNNNSIKGVGDVKDKINITNSGLTSLLGGAGKKPDAPKKWL